MQLSTVVKMSRAGRMGCLVDMWNPWLPQHSATRMADGDFHLPFSLRKKRGIVRAQSGGHVVSPEM